MLTSLEITSACQTIQNWAAADTSHRVAIIFVGEFRNLDLKRIDALVGQQARAIMTLVTAAKKFPHVREILSQTLRCLEDPAESLKVGIAALDQSDPRRPTGGASDPFDELKAVLDTILKNKKF